MFNMDAGRVLRELRAAWRGQDWRWPTRVVEAGEFAVDVGPMVGAIDPCPTGVVVKMTADPNVMSMYLTPDSARYVARLLVATADKAERRGDE